MFSTILTAAICGMDAVIIHVEVDVSQGLPGFLMVGYLGSEVKEAFSGRYQEGRDRL